MPISSSEVVMAQVQREKGRMGEAVPSHTTSAHLTATLEALAEQQNPNPQKEETQNVEVTPSDPVPSQKEEEVSPQKADDILPSESESETSTHPDRSRFETLAKRDREIRKREKALPKAGPNMDKLKEEAAANPIEFLRKFGLTYQDVANKLIENPSLAEASKAPSQADSAMSTRLEQVEAQLAEQRNATNARQYNSSMKTLLDEIRNFVDTKGDTYALVKARGDYPIVADLMQRYYNNTLDAETGVGKIMSYDEAASKVEAHLMEQARQYVGTEKIAALFANKEATPKPVPQENPGQRKTLTQEASAMPAKSNAEERPDNLNREDSIAWLARNLNFFES